MAISDKKLQGKIPYSEVLKIDKLGSGVYKIYTEDGNQTDLSLDKGEVTSISASLRFRKRGNAPLTSDDKETQDKPADSEASANTLTPERDLAFLERNLGNWMDVEFVDPAYGGYWSSDDDMSFFLSAGYKIAQPKQVQDFEMRFGNLNPGEGMNPGGAIKRNGLTLLIAPKTLQAQIDKYFYNKRPNVEERSNYISPQELAAKQATNY